MLRINALSLLPVICCSPGGVSAEEHVVKLGGVRNVTATIIEAGEIYRIAVEMLPVKAFDPATNKRVNLTKAQAYAVRALAKYLGAGKSSELVIHGFGVRESSASGEYFRMVAEITRKGVTVAAARTSPAQDSAVEPARQQSPSVQPTKQPPQSASSQPVIRMAADATTVDFLNRKADYLETIAQLREALADDEKTMDRSPLSPDEFYEAIATLEERSNAAFKSLGASIDGDKLLLSIETDELHLALTMAHAVTLESLKSAIAQFDQRQEKMKKEEETK
jgi:hypothetical protein